MMAGKLIVIDGADGAGGEEQSKRLLDYLEKEGHSAVRHQYPDYSGPVGNLIHEFLHGKHEFSPEMLLLLYGADFVKDIPKLESWLCCKHRFVVLDRYFTSTLAYQHAMGLEVEDMLRFAEVFKLPKPDLVIYLRVSPEVSLERKRKEKEDLDRHESDKGFISRVLESYEMLARGQVFGRWVTIDADRPIGEVFSDIREALRV